MTRTTPKKIGIFLGRLQPQHPGHEFMIEKIFRENDEVVLCIGSVQKIKKTDPAYERNPLSIDQRLKKLKAFLRKENFSKPYTIVTAVDIEPDSAWPAYLKECCNLSDSTENTIYFADTIAEEYKKALKNVGFYIRLIPRKEFIYKTAKNELHNISSATEIRAIEKYKENI